MFERVQAVLWHKRPSGATNMVAIIRTNDVTDSYVVRVTAK